ncbi:MAG: peptidoglycan recognition family protein [Planctomycetota bacterium]|nr:peptidoglycan recognition family protein [Planctomycetota bacterium]
MASINKETAQKLSKRTQNVWAAFFVTIATAMFVLQLGSDIGQPGIPITLAELEDHPEQNALFGSIESANSSAWNSIVVHHLGQPAGTVEQIDRDHRNSGLDGLAYHFLIGNGKGIGDGKIWSGYRWVNQLPSARLSSADTTKAWSNGVISICLVGNGNRRPFSEQQLVQLSRLVERLQVELSIPPDQIMLANQVDRDTQSPGQYFAEARFRSQLRDIPISN